MLRGFYLKPRKHFSLSSRVFWLLVQLVKTALSVVLKNGFGPSFSLAVWQTVFTLLFIV